MEELVNGGKDELLDKIIYFQKDMWYYRITAIFFQWAVLSELVIVHCFWIYLYLYEANLQSLPIRDIKQKLYFDMIVDVFNYDHSLPMLLLIIEYFVNNIPFQWSVLPLVLLGDYLYIAFQCIYCITHNETIYFFVDWTNHFWRSLAVMQLLPLHTVVFFLVIRKVDDVKFRINGILDRIKAIKT